MKIKDYIDAGNKIISNTTQLLFTDFLTQEGQTVINNNFKYQYFNREMVEDTQNDIDALVQYILLKNKIEYNKIYESLTANINPNKITSKETNSGKDTKDNSGTQENTVEFGKVVTTKPEEQTVTTTPATGKLTTKPAGVTVTDKPSANTVEEQGTDTQTSTRETKPFDNTEFTQTEKVTNVNTPNQKKTVTTYQNDAQQTTVYDNDEEVTETNITPQTVTNEVNSNRTVTDSGDETATRTDRLKEEFTHGHVIDREEVRPNDIIDNYDKLRAFYALNLWDRITKDILHFVCLDVWPTCYFNM